jgi:hypothetical protein
VKARHIFLTCAETEEQSAVVLKAILGEHRGGTWAGKRVTEPRWVEQLMTSCAANPKVDA